jgi:hypothetical protein
MTIALTHHAMYETSEDQATFQTVCGKRSRIKNLVTDPTYLTCPDCIAFANRPAPVYPKRTQVVTYEIKRSGWTLPI